MSLCSLFISSPLHNLKVRGLVFFLLALTVSSFGIPPNKPVIPSLTPRIDPCSPDNGQMYPHRRIRRSLPSNSFDRRQFIGVQFIPGQGAPRPSSTPTTAPAPKYVISQALIQQGPLNVNGTSQERLERMDVVIANASTTEDQVKCDITWNAELAGDDKTGYQLECEKNAFCVILQQEAPGPERGFYLYVALPFTGNTQVAWQVKNLQSTPGWMALGAADTETVDWGHWYFNGTAPLTQNPGIPLSQFTGP